MCTSWSWVFSGPFVEDGEKANSLKTHHRGVFRAMENNEAKQEYENITIVTFTLIVFLISFPDLE